MTLAGHGDTTVRRRRAWDGIHRDLFLQREVLTTTARILPMTSPTCFQAAVTAASLLLVGLPGCGAAPDVPVAAPAHQVQDLVPETDQLANSEEVAPETAPPTDDASATLVTSTTSAEQNSRNPFRPPTIKARKLTPQQAESADIRLLGIAKKESQHIALL